jgi:hypothetical protein
VGIDAPGPAPGISRRACSGRRAVCQRASSYAGGQRAAHDRGRRRGGRGRLRRHHRQPGRVVRRPRARAIGDASNRERTAGDLGAGSANVHNGERWPFSASGQDHGGRGICPHQRHARSWVRRKSDERPTGDPGWAQDHAGARRVAGHASCSGRLRPTRGGAFLELPAPSSSPTRQGRSYVADDRPARRGCAESRNVARTSGALPKHDSCHGAFQPCGGRRRFGDRRFFDLPIRVDTLLLVTSASNGTFSPSQTINAGFRGSIRPGRSLI